jgi:hypothetical protein
MSDFSFHTDDLLKITKGGPGSGPRAGDPHPHAGHGGAYNAIVPGKGNGVSREAVGTRSVGVDNSHPNNPQIVIGTKSVSGTTLDGPTKGGPPTLPKDCGARDFVKGQTLSQIGRMNIAAISGGRVDTMFRGTKECGIHLPVTNGQGGNGRGWGVNVFLANNDTYTVQRVQGDTVKGEQTNVYADEVGESAYQASSYKSNDFGGHKVE